MEALDILANNLANSGTGGYKLDREFYSLYQGQQALPAGVAGSTTLPVIQKRWTDFQQGTLQPTGNPLDLALTGKGFFVVEGPSGPLYTRNGSFKLSPTGVLTTMDGYAVRAVGPRDQPPKKIQTVSKAPIQVSPDGVLRQEGQELGKLDLVDLPDANTMEKLPGSYFRLRDPKIKPVAVTGTAIEQGKIEASNVVPAESAVRLVELMRQYEMLQKAVSVAAEMDNKVTQDVARTGS